MYLNVLLFNLYDIFEGVGEKYNYVVMFYNIVIKFRWDYKFNFVLLIVGVFIFVCGILVILCFDVVRRKVLFFYIFRSKFDYYIVIVGLLWVGWFVR